jgi:metal-dependent amidase/aminoacylase/carboxypeptidase family protein
MSNEIWIKANELKDYVTALRRQIHQHPELGGQEVRTAELICRELQSYAWK